MIIKFIKKKIVLFIFFILLIVLSFLYPYKIVDYPSFVDWKTLVVLTGLLIITTGLKESGYIFVISEKLLKKIKTERVLSFVIIILSAFLSTFLTNDVSLFIIIPLTLGMRNLIKNSIDKLLVFEIISVNVGSALTPIGNPQNLYLWHKWGISFIDFILKMFPVVILLIIILLIFAGFVFPDKKIEFIEKEDNIKQNKSLFILSAVLLVVYIFCLEGGCVYWGLLPIFIIYLLFYKKILLNVDWMFLLIFSIIFIDFHLISTIHSIVKIMNTINPALSSNVFLISALLSQIFSNVPTGVFISKFTNNWQALTYGVNVGGNGLFISSIANIIALQMINNKKTWINFHKYSILYFLMSTGMVFLIFYIL